jgi:hypothetical protein
MVKERGPNCFSDFDRDSATVGRHLLSGLSDKVRKIKLPQRVDLGANN